MYMRIIANLLAALLLTVSCASWAAETPALEQGKLLRAAADKGDADAMMALAKLLSAHAPAPKRPYKICDGKLVNPLIKQNLEGKDCKTVEDPSNKKLMDEWRPVGTKFDVAKWIDKAAQNGSREAIAFKCKTGNDPAAPADMRDEAKSWCSKL
jgi:hypothetical protein